MRVKAKMRGLLPFLSIFKANAFTVSLREDARGEREEGAKSHPRRGRIRGWRMVTALPAPLPCLFCP